jgi:ferrous iron transport protein A
MSLDELLPGQCAVITGILSADGLKRRMQGLGLRTGREVAVVRRARLGGPLQIRIGSTDLMIRPGDARLIHVDACA